MKGILTLRGSNQTTVKDADCFSKVLATHFGLKSAFESFDCIQDLVDLELNLPKPHPCWDAFLHSVDLEDIVDLRKFTADEFSHIHEILDAS